MAKAKPHEWALSQLAALLGTNAPSLGRYVNGLSYPTLQMMQKFQYVFGWPIAEQAELIPPYWEWPPQIDRTEVQATDTRYAYKLRKIMKEWAEANPRTVLSTEVRMHPALKAVQGMPNRGRGRPPKNQEPVKEERPLTVSKSPLARKR